MRNYYRCSFCLTVYALDEDQRSAPTCPACKRDGRAWHMGRVEAETNSLVTDHTRPVCDDRCTSARGPSCDCRCNGANHGSNLVVRYQTRDAIPDRLETEYQIAKARSNWYHVTTHYILSKFPPPQAGRWAPNNEHRARREIGLAHKSKTWPAREKHLRAAALYAGCTETEIGDLPHRTTIDMTYRSAHIGRPGPALPQSTRTTEPPASDPPFTVASPAGPQCAMRAVLDSAPTSPGAAGIQVAMF